MDGTYGSRSSLLEQIAPENRRAENDGGPASHHRSSERQLRWAHEHRRLHEAVCTFVRADAAFVNCGTDPVVEELAKERTIGKHDVVVLRLLYGAKVFTLVCATKRIWKDREARRRLLDLKLTAATRFGLKVALIPASAIQKARRRNAVHALAKSRALRPTRTERHKIVSYVLANNGGTLGDCASLVPGHPDPIGLVLNLCATGWLHLDRSAALGPGTAVSWTH